MNDPSQPSGFDWQACQAQERARARLAAEALVSNKTALFDALAAAAIATVTVRFDGYGDSGQIEEIDARAGDFTTALPAVTIPFAAPYLDNSGLETVQLRVREAIEAMAYAFLEQTHDGWENNEGAYGDFTFDVANRTITLDYNERIMTSENSQHSF
jgi:uncharacterized membrane protein